MTKEYLKMADVFPDNFNIDEIMVYNRKSGKFNGGTLEEYGLHAINSHDELVAEVERLRVVVDGVIAASKSMQDRKPLTPWGDGFKECAVSIERAISGVMSGELSAFPSDL